MEDVNDLVKSMIDYPISLNKYIFQESKEKLVVIGKYEDYKKVINNSEIKQVELKLEDTPKFKKLKKKTVKELKDIAKSKDLKKYSNLKEDDLIKLILSS